MGNTPSRLVDGNTRTGRGSRVSIVCRILSASHCLTACNGKPERRLSRVCMQRECSAMGLGAKCWIHVPAVATQERSLIRLITYMPICHLRRLNR